MKIIVIFVVLASSFSAATIARAEKQHQVKSGQNLARIANKYGIRVSELAAANGLTRASMLREGQVLIVPTRGEVYVRPGSTLSKIARKYNVSVRELAKQNRINPESNLRPGQRLILPGFEAAEKQEKAEKRWGRPKHPGVVTLYRVWSKQRARIRLVKSNGRVRPAALRRLRHLLRSRNSRRGKLPNRRLVSLIARISDHFGGRTINVISGYREASGYTKLSSRHVAGKAIDFRIRGVPTKVLADYCRKFSYVGVGYYPKSHFVHLDVRDRNAFWTDVSGPGEPPKIDRPREASREDTEPESSTEEEIENEAVEDKKSAPADLDLSGETLL